MCGIAGWFSSRPSDPSEIPKLRKMLSVIKHRGPDGDGLEVYDNARFGHVRLAIIDIATGAQPMLSETGSVAITFNGEIYNHKVLRKALEEQGAQFRTQSDTEVIANLYEKEGVAGLAKLRGMFAFALWDKRAKTGLLIRDGLGIKPLFYSVGEGNELVFSSEAKAILEKYPEHAELDTNALNQLMNFRYLPGDMTLFRNIRQLQPGVILEWKDGVIREGLMEQGSQKDLPEQSIGETLSLSVQNHLEADVPIGCYLSGGVDSALITQLALKHSPENSLHSYTLDVGDSPLELSNAKASAILLGIQNTSAGLPESPSQSFKKLIWHLEVPKVNSFQVYHLAGLVAKERKIALSGLGADELFLGYNAHQIFYFGQQLGRIPHAIRQRFASVLNRFSVGDSNDPWSEKSRAISLIGLGGDWSRFYGVLRNVWDCPRLRRLVYGPRMLDSQLSNSFDWINANWPQSGSPLSAMSRYEWDNKMVNDLLWQEDRCSMAHGLEVRVPFVDNIVRGMVDKYDVSELMPFGKKKHLLRKMAKESLPSKILNRPKSGFQVDSPTFFKSHLIGLSQEYLSEERVRNIGLFNPVFTESIKRLPAQKRYRWHFFMLYLMIGTHVWLELFEGKKD